MAGASSTLPTFLVGLTLVLFTAHALGVIADRSGFAPVVGELLTGFVLGPAVLGAILPSGTAVLVPVPAELEALATLGLVSLLVLAGTEVDLPSMRRYIRPTVALAVGASVVPFLMGFALGWFLPSRFLVTPESRLAFALFLATALSISAVPVAVRVLIDLDAIDRPVGQLTLTAAVIIDAAGWVALTVVADVARAGTVAPSILGQTLVVLVAFVAVTLGLGSYLVGPLFDVATQVRSPVVTGFAIVVGLGVGVSGLSASLGLEAVLGAFIAGVLVRTHLDRATSDVFQAATLGVFAPVFFATAGLRADLSGLFTPELLVLTGVTLSVAIVGKVLGVFVGTVFTDLSRPEAVCIAIGLNARGAMEIVVAALGLTIGIITPTVYTVIVLVAIVTSVMTPPLLRRALARIA